VFHGFPPCPDLFLEYQRFVNFVYLIIRAKSNLDTELFFWVVPFYILRYLLEWRERRELWGEGREVEEIDQSISRRIVFPYFIYVVAIFYLCCSHLYLDCRMFLYLYSLYFLGKYDVMLAIVIVLSNNIWCPISILCSDNVNCVTCFNLTSHWCSFIQVDHSPSFSNVYLQEQGILYIPAELSGDLWALGFLKICPIFLGGLKIVRILCLFNILSIRQSVNLLFLWHMGEWIESLRLFVLECVVLFIDYFDYVFFVESVFL